MTPHAHRLTEHPTSLHSVIAEQDRWFWLAALLGIPLVIGVAVLVAWVTW